MARYRTVKLEDRGDDAYMVAYDDGAPAGDENTIGFRFWPQRIAEDIVTGMEMGFEEGWKAAMERVEQMMQTIKRAP